MVVRNEAYEGMGLVKLQEKNEDIQKRGHVEVCLCVTIILIGSKISNPKTGKATGLGEGKLNPNQL